MRTIVYIVQKEFIQIFRNRSMLPLIFIMPIFQLLILVNAATFEMKHIRMHVVDNDLSSYSRKMISKFQGSPFYEITGFSFSTAQAQEALQNNKTDVILEIPADFEKNLKNAKNAKVQLTINAINGTAASLTNAYSSQIIGDFNKNIITETGAQNLSGEISKSINTTYSFWYNPELNYKTFMVPGILVLLVTLIGLLLTAMNIVREKEIGTIEQINVTPVKKYQFITGKLIPFWIIALFELAFGMIIGKLVFDIPMVGSVGLVFFVAMIYLLGIVGAGLLISTITSTQQQAMMVSFFFMIIFILMSGLFTSIESMPQWAQYFNLINPIAYFIRIIRMILLKGSGFTEILNDLAAIFGYGILMLSLAVWRYRKVV